MSIDITSGSAATEGERQLSAVLARSATDRAFRTQLLADPRGAFAEALGCDVPASFDVVFIENTVDATIVLPDAIDAAGELSEGELEAVAGGITPAIATILSFAAAGVLVGQLIGQAQHNSHSP